MAAAFSGVSHVSLLPQLAAKHGYIRLDWDGDGLRREPDSERVLVRVPVREYCRLLSHGMRENRQRTW